MKSENMSYGEKLEICKKVLEKVVKKFNSCDSIVKMRIRDDNTTLTTIELYIKSSDIFLNNEIYSSSISKSCYAYIDGLFDANDVKLEWNNTKISAWISHNNF